MASATTARSRVQSRRKPNDDASYAAPPLTSSNSGSKRHAVDKPDGEPRMKRKRVETVQATNQNTTNNGRRDGEEVNKSSLVEFSRLPTTVLHRYLTQHNIIPDICPSPLSPDDPPSPPSLGEPYNIHSPPSPPFHPTPANRPRREASTTTQARTRSSRTQDDDIRVRTPILADVEQLHVVLAGIVERHFYELTTITPTQEVDTLASFMCAIGKQRGKAY